MCDLIPIPGEFDDANDFWKHPIYDRYEANRLGVVRHVVNKKDIGNLEKSGYIRFLATDKGKRKHYLKHRFIYECFFGLTEDSNKVVDHKNNIKNDNRLHNLQLISQSENQLKANREGKNMPPIKVRAINLDTGETSEYCSINECSKKLDINHGSIGKVINGITKTAKSKKDKCKYKFEKLNFETESHSIKVRSINIYTNESTDYDSICECSRDLEINDTSIGNILKGTQRTAKSKKDKFKYTFKKI